MECYTVRSKLEKYLDEALTEGERHAVSVHLQDCADCAREFDNLKHLEGLFKNDLFEEPPKEYWRHVPKRITSRLGFKEQPGVFEKLRVLVKNSLIQSRRVRWGLATAFAGLAVVILVRLIYSPTISEAPVVDAQDTKKGPVVSKLTNELNKSDETLPLISENTEKNKAIALSTQMQKVGQAGSPSESDSENKIVASVEDINVLTPHTLKRKTYSHSQQLIPVSNTSLITNSGVKVEDSNEGMELPTQRTLAIDNISSSQILNFQKESDKLREMEDSFTETLWIVQQSHSLSEKRNIWLSYIGREKDPTYRSLAIYHLALVLSQIAENTKDAEMAQEALNFYRENEKSLRFQMGVRRYQIKINILETIMRNN